MIVNVIVQARLGSTRLPGKVMLMAAGKPLIGHLVERLRRCTSIDRVIVAGPMADQHGPLRKYLHEIECDHFFGEAENDLCARYLSAIALFPCDGFIRICADSPLIQPEIVEATAAALRAGVEFHSTAGMKAIPPGNAAEGVSVKFYRETICRHCAPEDREHAGFPWLYRELAKQSTLVDTPADFERVKRMIEDA